MEQPSNTETTAPGCFIRVVQFILGVGGLICAYLHAFPLTINAKDQNLPIVDLTTLAWLGLVAIAAILPRVSEIAFGSVSVKLQEAKESAAAYQDVSDDLAKLVQNWSSSTFLLLNLLLRAADQDARNSLSRNFLRDRLGEARQFVSDSPALTARLAVWIYDDSQNAIVFRYSPQFTPTRLSWQVGEGFLGQAYLESRIYNEADVRLVPSYVPTREGDPPYRAVMCVPIIFLGEDRPIGLLTVDKAEAIQFSPRSVEIAKGLAALVGYALTLISLADTESA